MGLLASGCSELVDLGSECPPDVRTCDEFGGRGDAPPPGPTIALPLDAGVGVDTGMDDPTRPRDGAPPDAGMSADGSGSSSGGEPLQMPALLNRSFELTQGNPGDITTVSLPSFTAIAPWYTCQAIGQGSQGALTAVRAERTIADEPPPALDAGTPERIAPTNEQTFVSIRYFVNVVQFPLIQRLMTPLQPGTRYGFAIDVRTTSSRPHLALQIKSGNDCLGVTSTPEVLFTTTPIARGDWQKVCISFAPKNAHTLLGLQAVSTEALSNDMLLLDNLREDPDCF